jgi:glyoxylase-like metal-dependent hydrolase (beta-lactamase superfamily II)
VGGINAVKNQYHSKLWAMDHLVDVIEHPAAYNLPCLWHEGTKVDRVLHDGEKIDFDGLALQFFYLPGQTEFTEGLLLEDGGKRILFDGDNVAHPLPGTPLRGHFVCRNYQRIGGGHVYSASKILQLHPDYIAPNHFEWNLATTELMQSYVDSSEEVQNAWKQIIDQPDPELGVDSAWASFYPYQVEVGPGAEIRYEVRIRNWLDRPSHIRVLVACPTGWSCEPQTAELEVPAKSSSTQLFVVTIPLSEYRLNRRFVLTADVWRDGNHLGEIAEALINLTPMRAH